MEQEKYKSQAIRIPIGMHILLWFTDPDNTGGDQQLCTEFCGSLKEAEDHASLLSGDRMILMATGQNPFPDSNIYWSPVKVYGKSFELNKLTMLPEDLHKQFLAMAGDSPNTPSTKGLVN